MCLENCLADIDGEKQKVFDIGVCNHKTCARKNAENQNNATMCCEMKDFDIVRVDCGTCSYNVTRTLSCGCTKCSVRRQFQVSGIVRYADPDSSQVITVPDRQIKFIIGTNEYVTEADGSFREVISVNGDYIVIIFPGDQVYSSRVESIPLESGINNYETFIALDFLPQPELFDPSDQQVLLFGTGGSVPLDPMLTMTIPPNSITFDNGDPLPQGSIVEAYKMFADPRVEGGLDRAPIQFVAGGSDGFVEPLVSGGVLNLELLLNGTNQVLSLPGNVRIDVDVNQLEPGFSLWLMDEEQGMWSNPVSMSDVTSDGSRKKRQVPEDCNNQTADIPLDPRPLNSRGRPCNIDTIRRMQRERYARCNPGGGGLGGGGLVEDCFVRVTVYRDHSCDIPASDVSIYVYTKDSDGFRTIGRTVGQTDYSGKACVPLLSCDNEHEIRLNTFLPHEPSDKHVLPSGFNFRNTAKKVIFQSADVFARRNGDGPVHTNQKCGDRNPPDYHFVFSFNNYVKPGRLIASVPAPGLMNSWYQDLAVPSQRIVAMVRVRVDVSITYQMIS